MSNTPNNAPKVDNVMYSTNYRIPLYGNLIKPSNNNKTDYQGYYPVIATSNGSCLAVDCNKVYVPIKVPAVDEGECIDRYIPSDNLGASYDTVIDARDLPPIDIRLLVNCGSTKIDPDFYCTGSIGIDKDTGELTSSGDSDNLVKLCDLKNALENMGTYLRNNTGIKGSPAFWTTPVKVTN